MSNSVRSLAVLLSEDRENSDPELFYRGQELSRQVSELPLELRDELASRLQDAWPQKGFASLITLREARSFSINVAAVAWLTYGPALDLAITADQWAAIAVSGVSLDESAGWLRRQWTPQALSRTLELATSSDARVWEQIVSSTPGRLPDALVEALTARFRTFTDEQTYEIHRIGERLAAEQRTDALRALSDADPRLEARLRGFLGHLGDGVALESLFQELKGNLATTSVDRDSVQWLEGAKDVRYLPELFECLFLARRKETDPFGPSGVIEYVIAEIGGEEVVARYDEAISSRPFDGAQFLRIPRDRVAQRELKSAGSAAALELAEVVGVPLLPSEVQ